MRDYPMDEIDEMLYEYYLEAKESGKRPPSLKQAAAHLGGLGRDDVSTRLFCIASGPLFDYVKDLLPANTEYVKEIQFSQMAPEDLANIGIDPAYT